jgi:outer membrane murein-binding lipoprotein Lpp
MTDPAVATGWLPYAVGIIIAIFGGGGFAALMKARPEGSKIVVDAAQGAVIVQSGVISDLRHQLQDTQDQLSEMRHHFAEQEKLRTENDALRARVASLENDNARLTQRVADLEQAST